MFYRGKRTNGRVEIRANRTCAATAGLFYSGKKLYDYLQDDEEERNARTAHAV